MGGAVVRAAGGTRDRYLPWTDSLAGTAEPEAVAIALFGAFGTQTFYVADLDAIEGRAPNRSAIGSLVDAGFAIWLDAGMERATDFAPWRAAGAARGVFGSETLADWSELQLAAREFGSERVVFSTDLRKGTPLRRRGARPLEGAENATACARRGIEAGARTLILLELADVGARRGVSTLDLARELKREFADAQVLVGGGVRDLDDLRAACEAADGALVATALHAGAIGPEEWSRWRRARAVL
jgi:phosphoribosylformimino-5-aminoimidazole carboxamide ribotide isomerase